MADTYVPTIGDKPEPAALTPPSTEAETARREWSRHPINIRMSLPLLFGRYYVTLVAGKERRGEERRRAERQKNPLDTANNATVYFLTGGIVVLAMFGATLMIMANLFGWSFVAAG